MTTKRTSTRFASIQTILGHDGWFDSTTITKLLKQNKGTVNATVAELFVVGALDRRSKSDDSHYHEWRVVDGWSPKRADEAVLAIRKMQNGRIAARSGRIRGAANRIIAYLNGRASGVNPVGLVRELKLDQRVVIKTLGVLTSSGLVGRSSHGTFFRTKSWSIEAATSAVKLAREGARPPESSPAGAQPSLFDQRQEHQPPQLAPAATPEPSPTKSVGRFRVQLTSGASVECDTVEDVVDLAATFERRRRA